MNQQTIVFIHGIWMPGNEMLFLKQNLSRYHGYKGELFSYPSVTGTLDDNAQKLADFVHAQGSEKFVSVGIRRKRRAEDRGS